jgi:hypothetical protein
VGGDLAVRQPLRRQRQHHLVHPGQAPLPLLDNGRLKRSGHVPGDLDLDRANIGQHRLRPCPVAAVATAPTFGIVFLVSEVIGDLALQGGLQDPLGQLLEQPALPSQLQALRPGPVHEHRNQLLVTRRHGPRRRLAARYLLDGGVAHLASP